MGLINNAYHTLKTPSGNIIGRFIRENALRQSLKENFNAFGQYVSMPQGYQDAAKATIPTLKESFNLRCILRGDSSLVNTGITMPVTMEATVSGEGFLNPDMEVGKTLAATVVGTGSLSVDVRTIVNMSARIDAGARPSAFDIAQEVWQSQKTAYNAPGTMGNALNSAGTAGDPWTADLSIYPPGSAGYILYSLDPQQLANAILTDPRLLTVAKFLGLK